jgi:hypothetical protein
MQVGPPRGRELMGAATCMSFLLGIQTRVDLSSYLGSFKSPTHITLQLSAS